MNVFGWKKTRKEIKLESILDNDRLGFSPNTVDLDFDIETIYKNPEKFFDMNISIRHIDFDIAKQLFCGKLFVESGNNLIALCLLYMALKHQGTKYSVFEDVLMDDEGYAYAKKLPQEEQNKYDKWVSRMDRKIKDLIFSGLVDNLDELCKKFANMKVIADVYEVVYIGPTKTVRYSEDMTIREFSEMISHELNVIPTFIRKGAFFDCPASMRLKELGVTGEKYLDVKIKTYVSTFSKELKEQNNLDVIVDCKYVSRPWALIEKGTFDDIKVLPSFWNSLGGTLLTRLVYKFLT